ncbi:NIPSNAP family protein [Sphingomonas oligophenolica]|uniref:NIPSNAP family protein n=1 Tax=Sphingomonas oligophenolica TaxID=301154 RepID=A0ABU9Y971_9SPHN
MIIDHRTYTIYPSKFLAFLELWQSAALPVQLKHSGRFLGMFITDTGPVNSLLHMWAYEDAADREARRRKFEALPEWIDYRRRLDALDALDKVETKLIRPAPFVTLEWPMVTTG